MTEKRFTFADGFKIVAIRDNGEIMNSIRVCDKLNELYEENQLLRNFKEKSDKFTEEVENFFEKHDIDTVNFDLIDEEFELYQKENEQLKERNNRQCKQLDDLYRLIEEKDWRALSDIIDDFKKADEQLQKEWGTYGDIE